MQGDRYVKQMIQCSQCGREVMVGDTSGVAECGLLRSIPGGGRPLEGQGHTGAVSLAALPLVSLLICRFLGSLSRVILQDRCEIIAKNVVSSMQSNCGENLKMAASAAHAW